MLAEQPAQLLIALGSRLPVAGVNTMSAPAFAASLVAAPTSPAGVSNLLAVAAFAPGATDGVAFLQRVQQEYPADFWANFALGNALMSHGAGEAIGYYQAALAVRPQAVAVHNNLGLALRSLGRPRQAIDLLGRALHISPGDPILHNNIGIALIQVARPVEAIEHFRQALAELPNSAALHNNLGIALKARGQLDEAIAEYLEAIRIEPNDPRFHINLASVQLSKGRTGTSGDSLGSLARTETPRCAVGYRASSRQPAQLPIPRLGVTIRAATPSPCQPPAMRPSPITAGPPDLYGPPRSDIWGTSSRPRSTAPGSWAAGTSAALPHTAGTSGAGPPGRTGEERTTRRTRPRPGSHPRSRS
jgi:Flp pilus assembly protein TadD